MKYSNIMLEQTGQMQTDGFVILFTRKDVISRRRAPYTVSQKKHRDYIFYNNFNKLG